MCRNGRCLFYLINACHGRFIVMGFNSKYFTDFFDVFVCIYTKFITLQ